MTISLIQSIPVGNALRLFLSPPLVAKHWRVLRRTADSFTGPDDAGAYVVYEGKEKAITDAFGLYNGIAVFYRVYYWTGTAWLDSASRSAVPNPHYADASVDVLGIVRDRLDLGLQTYVDAGQLQHSRGHIPVMTASPSVEDANWPMVTVHLSADSSSVRALGEMPASDMFAEGDYLWHSYEGWLSRWQLSIIGWSLNSDERILLRKAIKTILIANLSIFDSFGMVLPDMQFSDDEDFTSYQAPVYRTICTFSCVAPSQVDGADPAIREVITTNLTP